MHAASLDGRERRASKWLSHHHTAIIIPRRLRSITCLTFLQSSLLSSFTFIEQSVSGIVQLGFTADDGCSAFPSAPAPLPHQESHLENPSSCSKQQALADSGNSLSFCTPSSHCMMITAYSRVILQKHSQLCSFNDNVYEIKETSEYNISSYVIV